MDSIDSDLHSFLPQLIGPNEVTQSLPGATERLEHKMSVTNMSLTSLVLAALLHRHIAPCASQHQDEVKAPQAI